MVSEEKGPNNLHIWHKDPDVVHRITPALIKQLGWQRVGQKHEPPYYSIVREDHFDTLLQENPSFRKFIFDTGCSVGKSTLGKDPQEYTQPITDYARARGITAPGAQEADREKLGAVSTIRNTFTAFFTNSRRWVKGLFPEEMVAIGGNNNTPVDREVVRLLQKHIGKRQVVRKDMDLGEEGSPYIQTVRVEVPKKMFDEQVVRRNAGELRDMLSSDAYYIDDGKGSLSGRIYMSRVQAEVEQAPKGWRKGAAVALEGVGWFNRNVSIVVRVGLAAVVGAIGFMHLVAIPWLKSLVNTTTPYQRSIDNIIDDAPNAAPDVNFVQPKPGAGAEKGSGAGESEDKAPAVAPGEKDAEKKAGEVGEKAGEADKTTPHTDKAVEGATERREKKGGRGR